jgi:hypothetical protein
MNEVSPLEPLPPVEVSVQRLHEQALERLQTPLVGEAVGDCPRHRFVAKTRGVRCPGCEQEAVEAASHPPSVEEPRDRPLTPAQSDSFSRWLDWTTQHAKPDTIRPGSRAEGIAEALLEARVLLAEAEVGPPRVLFEGGYSHRRVMYEKPAARAARVRKLQARVEHLESELSLAQKNDREGRSSYIASPPSEAYGWQDEEVEQERDSYLPGTASTETAEKPDWRRWFR